MSGSYSRLAAIRDYWMPRDPDARAEVRVTDLDEILRKIEPAQEPVAWMYTGIKSDSTEHGPHLVWKPAYMDAMSASKGAQATPLYLAPPQSRKQEALASMYIALCDAIGYSARSNELQSPEEWATQLYAHYASTTPTAEPVQEPDVPEATFGNLKPVGWFEPPHGAFRANPQYRIRFPSQLLSWQIPLYTHPPKAEPESVQEPYCHVYEYDSVFGLHRDFYPREYNGRKPDRTVPLFSAPPQRPPLTDEEIDALALEVRCDPAALRSAIERKVRGEKE